MVTQRVFLSHSYHDKAFVRAFDSALHAFGVTTFLDERDIRLGEDIPQRIYAELSLATHVFYFLSSSSVRSKWVQEELSVAKMREKEERGVVIIPILIEKGLVVPSSVVSKRYADFSAGVVDVTGSGFQLVLEAMGVVASGASRFDSKTVRQKSTRESLKRFAARSAKMVTELLDVSFMLRFATETDNQVVSSRRMHETRLEIEYRGIRKGVEEVADLLRTLAPVGAFEPHIQNVAARVASFASVMDVVEGVSPGSIPAKETLWHFAEVARYLSSGMSRAHELALLLLLAGDGQ